MTPLPTHGCSAWFRRHGGQHGGQPLVYGHRGAPRALPENTLSSFRTALAQGADGIELDVRACADGLVVFHDPDLQRMAGRRERVADMSLTELAALNLGAGEGAPSLDATIAAILAQRDARLNIEIKVDDRAPSAIAALTERVCTVIEALPPLQRERVLVSSFGVLAIETATARLGAAHTALLLSKNPERWPPLPQRCGLNPHYSRAQAVSAFVDEGRLVNVWTVNEPDRARDLSRLGVDGIITDDVPGTLRVLARS